MIDIRPIISKSRLLVSHGSVDGCLHWIQDDSGYDLNGCGEQNFSPPISTQTKVNILGELCQKTFLTIKGYILLPTDKIP